jgi:hypothetical protein
MVLELPTSAVDVDEPSWSLIGYQAADNAQVTVQ